MKMIRKMKSYRLLTLIITAGLIFGSCNTDTLQELNIDPLAANDIDPGYVLAYTQLQTSGERYENWRAQLIYQSTMMQVFATLPGYWSGDKYLRNSGYSSALWDRAYGGYIKDLVNLIEITDPESVGDNSQINYHAIARIWKAYAFSRVTDLYGDVPYSEAGLGFLDNLFLPKYDMQQDIYADMLNELEVAAGLLTSAEDSPGNQDLIYGGDLDQWRRFAYSLMFRLGMRLSKVAASDAQAWVAKAIAGGPMESNADICKIIHTDGPEGINRNGLGEVFNWNGERYTTDDSPRLSKTLVDHMKTTTDPRLGRLSWVVDSDNDQYDPDLAFQDALGMPNGYDAATIQTWPDYIPDNNLDNFSRIKPDFVLRESPMVFQTYAEVCFLYAEAFEKGWAGSAPGDAATWYGLGVEAAMQMYEQLYGSTVGISQTEIDDYIAANPYAGGEDGLKQIGEQVWIATILNFYETYANWRRTGYPELTPVDYPGNVTNGTIPRRLEYSQGEASVNAENYDAAASRMGGDLFTSRVWWDAN
jgi:hypothetical protein